MPLHPELERGEGAVHQETVEWGGSGATVALDLTQLAEQASVVP